MKISIIIPSYKPDSYLYECLDSVCNQTLDNSQYEVLIILNGCDEPYKSQISTYINHHRDTTIRLIQTDVPGVSKARNKGIDDSKGEFLCFVDDDDIISPTYLEGLLKVSSYSCIGCSNSYAFKTKTVYKTDNFLSVAYRECAQLNYSLFKYRHFLSPPYAKLISRKIIGEMRFPINLSKSEDSVFCLLISPQIKAMKLATEDVVYYQRQRLGSAMRTNRSFILHIKDLLEIEKTYFLIWVRHPFKYNFKFIMSRMLAGVKNFLYYTRFTCKIK